MHEIAFIRTTDYQGLRGTVMKKINIIARAVATQSNDRPNPEDLAASIDMEIFNADDLSADGERFWEAYWKTQHVYGGVSPGQSLDVILKEMDNRIFEKLRHDMMCFGDDDHVGLDDAEKNDIFGMIVFLLCIEKGDSRYDPIQQEGYDAALSYFFSRVSNEYLRRAGQDISSCGEATAPSQ